MINFWKKTGNDRIDGINIIKSWLCDATEGQTYSITDNVLKYDVDKIQKAGYVYDFPEDAFDRIVGFKHDYHLDDEILDEIAEKMYDKLVELDDDIVNHPEKYFNRINTAVCRPIHSGIACDYCYGTENRCTYEKECPFKIVKSSH